MNIISIKDLNFKYKDKIIFENMNLNIKKGKITTIIGKNGSGKSTLIKMILGLIPSDDKIKFNKTIINKDNIREIRKKIGVVFEEPDTQIIGQTVLDNITFILENMNYPKEEIDEKINKIVEEFNLHEIINESPSTLNNSQKQLVNIVSSLVHNPDLLILDESLMYIDPIEKDNILNHLIKLNKKGLTIIIVTNDIEDTLISDEIIVLGNKNILLNGKKTEVYKEEKTLNKLGFKLPFIVELSNRLKFYDLIDKTIYDEKKLVDTLWQ